ncbi:MULTISPECIES: NAD(P)H-dependent flavin oxidoreductase [Providencia]|uniref:NAD(P)H-dependent flavin oxidoreductase n=1 Tax=Providencia TaxID=586 RepID=UPI0013A7916C|nr:MULTISPECIES: nitronate monooxygenase [Providencia]MBQ0455912.1 nitronate monooxygenase [Providencia stuartii]QIB28526.1 nitronate monooxygenase [Providencia stuartii]QPN40861.1 nitronate monooxygenase [Providencia sp. 2.29]WAZ78495.1 nitronate monooxygenase [Providencia stuartii]WAZ84201.1 nitronate monooxygenase [Providencia stuartii]
MEHSEVFLQRLGLRYPIIQAPMAGVSIPELAAAVSEAGGLGSLGLGASSVPQAKALIEKTNALTDKPFNVNVFCHSTPVRNREIEQAWIHYFAQQLAQFNVLPPQQLNQVYTSFLDDPHMLALLLEMRPAVVSFHFNIPDKQVIDQLKAQGIYTMATATCLREAQLIEQAGIDAIIAQGIEAGGHRGMFDVNAEDEAITTFHLVELLVKNSQLPIIAAGGLMDGQEIKTALEQGAVAAQLGTAFILCPESAANEGYRHKLKSQNAADTALTAAISGRPARGIVNQFIRMTQADDCPAIPDYPIAYDLGKQLHAAASKMGSDDFAAHWAGQNALKAREMPASVLVETLVSEMTK